MKTTQISTATLSAIKNLLLETENGINIKPLVDDLKVGDVNEDLLAINIALVMRGVKPTISNESRYREYDNMFFRYDFVSYSLIHDLVTATETKFRKLENGDGKQVYKERSITMNVCEWESLKTSL